MRCAPLGALTPPTNFRYLSQNNLSGTLGVLFTLPELRVLCVPLPSAVIVGKGLSESDRPSLPSLQICGEQLLHRSFAQRLVDVGSRPAQPGE